MLKLMWNLDTEKQSLGRKSLKHKYLPKSKQLNSWPIFIQLLCIHNSQSLNVHFFSQIILQSTTLYRIIALIYFSIKGIQCTSPALDITRTGNNFQNYQVAPFHPKPQEILPIQTSKNKGPAALQIYFTPLRVHISHSHTSVSPIWFGCSLCIFFSYSLLFHSVTLRLLKKAKVCSWHDLGKREETTFFTLLIFQHCWSLDPDWCSQKQ